jgi:RNA polymerase sigma-70 factor (ECF subfamily)
VELLLPPLAARLTDDADEVGPDPDADLVARAQVGDGPAFAALVRRYQGRLLGLARRYLGDGPEAEDVAQQAFVQAFKNLGQFRGEARLGTWLYRITVNLAKNALRARPSPEAAGSAAAEPLAPATLDPEEQRRLRQAVRQLPEKQRLVVELRIWQELSFREIAEVAGGSEESAKVSFHHAIKRLRSWLLPGETSP